MRTDRGRRAYKEQQGRGAAPKPSSELNGRYVRDAKQLSSWRREGTGTNRPLPTPKPISVCSLILPKFLYSWKCLWKASHGTKSPGNAHVHIHTHSTINGIMREKTTQNRPTGTLGNIPGPQDIYTRGDPGWIELLSHWAELGSC